VFENIITEYWKRNIKKTSEARADGRRGDPRRRLGGVSEVPVPKS
jgi:hypothetical protein